MFPDGFGDVEEIVAFGDTEFIEMYVAARDAVEDLPGGGWLRELVFAGLELPAGLEKPGQGELPTEAENALACELVADVARGGAAVDIENGAGRGGLIGHEQRAGRGGEEEEDGGERPAQALHPIAPR